MTSELGRCTIDLPAELEDVVVAQLWEAGTTGLQVHPSEGDRVRIEAYFENEAPSILFPPEVVSISRDRLVQGDWLANYRATAPPLVVGRRFVLDPREPGDEGGRALEAPGDEALREANRPRFHLRLPARRAFGTGSHPTTQLAVEGLERLADEEGLDRAHVLDVGCGTGVLSFAALLLGAHSVVAFDIDLVSPVLTLENTALNEELLGKARPRVFAGRVSALRPTARFDLVVVNVLAARIRDDISAVASRVGERGRVIVSGLLRDEADRELEYWRSSGLGVEHRTSSEEWSCSTLRRVS